MEFSFRKSKRRNKKYDAVFTNGAVVSFGDNRYKHYFDRIGLYSHLNHNDEKRRDAYYARHNANPRKYSPGWFAANYLW